MKKINTAKSSNNNKNAWRARLDKIRKEWDLSGSCIWWNKFNFSWFKWVEEIFPFNSTESSRRSHCNFPISLILGNININTDAFSLIEVEQLFSIISAFCKIIHDSFVFRRGLSMRSYSLILLS